MLGTNPGHPWQNQQALMLLNVFFKDSETLNNLETDLVLGNLGPHSISYTNKRKAEHGSLASSYA